MKYLNGEYYVEVKDHRYRFHPTEKIILRKRGPPTSLRTLYQVENETQIRKNQKVVENNGKLEANNYPNNKQLPNCPSFKRNIWLQFVKRFYCRYGEYIINEQKHQIDKKVLRQDHNFSTRLKYARKR